MTYRTPQALVNEMTYLKHAIELAWQLQAYDSVQVLASYLLTVRQEYKSAYGGCYSM